MSARFTSDRMRLLGPMVTDAAIELARKRLADHRERVNRAPCDVETKRVALILFLEMNPRGQLTNEEEGLLRGMKAETFSERRRAGEL